jgi:hypothetical protein
VWITHGDRGIWLRAAVIPALAYGMTAFWLVPSYFRVTTVNLKLVAERGNAWSIWVALAVLAVYLLITARWAHARPDAFYAIFVTGFALFFVLNVAGNEFFGFRVAGEPGRLVPELDLALILLAGVVLQWLWKRPARIWRYGAAGLAIAAFATSVPYVRRAWLIVVPYPNYEDRIEYKITHWMAANLPGARTMATGSVRFWYDAWHDLAQIGGGSEQGTLNQTVNIAYSYIANDPDVDTTLHWLQAFGLDAVIVHDNQSQEIYHDYTDPRKFTHALPVVFDNHAGDVIYRVPRRFPDLARVVDSARVRSLPPIGPLPDLDALRNYAQALEQGPDARAVTAWDGVERMRIAAEVAAGQSVIAQVAYDPQWRARSGAGPLEIRKDAAGQMLIETPPGRHEIELSFETPLENRIGRIVSALSALIALALLGLGVRREVAP